MSRRERVAELLLGGALVATAIAMAVLLDGRRMDLGLAVALVCAFALATRVKLDVGAGYTVPTQLVFVPMLLLLPTATVPLLVLAGWTLGQVPDVVSKRMHPDRLLLAAANSWFAVGPAAALIALDATDADLGNWPAYLVALAAQFACDFASQQLRERLGRGLPLPAGLLIGVYAIDTLLAPVGLLAAIAARNSTPYAVLLLAPAVGLFVVFARERSRRIADALALNERERETAELATQLLEAERAATRGREDILAGATTEVLTPLAALSGLVSRLRASDPADVDRRDAVEAAMLREVHQIRHFVGQFLDYARLKAGRELAVECRPCEVEPLLRQVAEAFPPADRVTVEAEADLPSVLVDSGRVGQMLLSLAANGVKFSPRGSGVELKAVTDPAGVRVTVTDHGAGIPEADRAHVFEELRRGANAEDAEGVGLGLYLCRVLADAQQIDLSVDSGPETGTCFTLILPVRTEATHERERRAFQRRRSLR
jgi:signal transduction histidine kinase